MSKSPRPIRIEGDVAYVPLTKGYTAIIDAADVPLVSAWSWQAKERRRPDGTLWTVYACRSGRENGKKTFHLLHRALTGYGPGVIPDHIDGNGLNNRRLNLRPATVVQNGYNCARYANNTSGAKGVSFHKQSRKWAANIRVDGVQRTIGRFRCVTAAALAYAKASRELHGEFGRVA